MSSSSQHAPATDSHTDSVIPVKPAEEEILDVLSEFESGLESLKALYVQRQKLQTRIREQEEQCKQREVTLGQRAAEVEQTSKDQQRRAAELEEAKARLEQREQELAAARLAVEQQQAALSQTEPPTRKAPAVRPQALEEQADKLAKESDAVAQLTTALSAQARELESARASSKKEQEARQQEAAQLESFRKQAEAQRAILDASEARSDELSARVETLGKQLEEARQEAARHAQLASKLEAGAAEGAGGAASARLAELEAKWTQEKSQSARLMAAISQHQTDAAELEKVLDELKVKLQEEVASRDQFRRRLESAEDALAKANARAEALQTKLAALLAEVAAFKEQASRQAAAPKVLVPSSAASMLRRRQRLKVYRDLVREQSLKVRKASDALKKKVEACEQVLGHRAELAAIRDRVLEGERRLQRRQAGSRAAVVMLCTVAAFAMLAALSWALAREIAPATYMATSAIKADGRTRELNEGELAEWTQFHEGLLNDPRFHESAADRFQRAGFPQLATPEAVAQLVRNDLTTEDTGPGEIELHLKGQGSDRAQRMLETMTAALVSHANGLQQKRIDGGVTVVSMASTSAGEPLDNTLMLYFVGILLAGMTVAIVFLVVLWKRLAGAKTAFEQDTVVGGALDDAKWASFAAATAAQQGSSAAKNKPARAKARAGEDQKPEVD